MSRSTVAPVMVQVTMCGQLPPILRKSGGRTCKAMTIGRFKMSAIPESSTPRDLKSGSTTRRRSIPVATTPVAWPHTIMLRSNQSLGEEWAPMYRNHSQFTRKANAKSS
ncbi:MAG: hypothetical protein PWQ41_1268 [Bacillota bacterium]|nr:hypothetical protein [Bacillota bacterium]